MLLAGAMCAARLTAEMTKARRPAAETSGEAKYNVQRHPQDHGCPSTGSSSSRAAEAYAEEHPDQISVDVKGPPSETSFQEQLNMIQTDLSDRQL